MIFIHIPKCAGCAIKKNYLSYWTWLISSYANDSNVLKALYFKYGFYLSLFNGLFFTNGGELMWHRPVSEYDKHETSYTVVRNPYTRFLSMYNFLYGVFSMTPKEFYDYVVDQINKDTRTAFFYKPQAFYVCSEGKIAVDIILRYETLSDDFEKMCTLYNLDYTLDISNKSTKYMSFNEFYEQLDSELVYELYKNDFELFGYSRKLNIGV